MATNKPRFSLTFDKETLDRVDKFRADHKYSTRSSAIQKLIEAGLAEYDTDAKAERAKQLDRLRNDPRTRVLLDVSEKMTESEISQVEAFARFLRSNDK